VTWTDGAPASTDLAVEESYRVLRDRIDLTRLPRLSRDITERVIYATADFDYYTDLICDEDALGDGVAALAAGATVVVDTAMVAGVVSFTCRRPSDSVRWQAPQRAWPGWCTPGG